MKLYSHQGGIVYGDCIHLSKDEKATLNGYDRPEDDRKYSRFLFEKCFTDGFFQRKTAEGNSSVQELIRAIESTNQYFIANGEYLCQSFF